MWRYKLSFVILIMASYQLRPNYFLLPLSAEIVRF
jgi:hypothetical protein